MAHAKAKPNARTKGGTIDIRLELPRPHALQHAIMLDPARYKVVCMGRRFGKTILQSLMAVGGYAGGRGLLNGGNVMYVSPTIDQTRVFWKHVNNYLAPMVGCGAVKINKSTRTVSFRAGGGRVYELTARTGSNPDTLRGNAVDLLLLDEAASQEPDLWYEVGAPMLMDTKGVAVFVGTPNRKNWFYHLWGRGMSGLDGWKSWQASTYANPYLSPDEIDFTAAQLSEQKRRQEIDAEFLEDEGTVFRNISACVYSGDMPEPYTGQFVMGVDTAQAQDYTVLVVLDTDSKRVVAVDRFNRCEWAVYAGRIQALATRWHVQAIEFEVNSAGSPMYEQLRNMGLPVKPFTTTAQSKLPLIDALVLAFERGEISIPNHTALVSELGAYERTTTAHGRSQYSAPSGVHDDTVMALALAWRGVFAQDTVRAAFF